jgi:hypothetical protein
MAHRFQPASVHRNAFSRVAILDGSGRPSMRAEVLAHFRTREHNILLWESAVIQDPTVSALILDGAFEQGSAGLRFRLLNDSSSTGAAPKESSDGSQSLVSAERLVGMYPRAAACILHYGASEGLLGTELGRRQARLARAFAEELGRGGVPLVIVLPQGPVQNLRRLLKALPPGPAMRTDDVCKALRDIQSTYLPSVDEPRASADAVALGMSVLVTLGGV